MRRPLLLCLMLAGLHLSSQDLVTTSPNHAVTTRNYSQKQSTAEMPTIRSLHIVSDVKYRYATTLISSRIVNPTNQSAETAFTMTLSGDVKGIVYKAYVKEKEEARETYDSAVNAGEFAGHVALGSRDSNQFTVTVNIEAQGKVIFNLTYEQLLSRSLGKYSNVINIDPQQIVKDMSVTVIIEEPTAIKNLEVPEITRLTNATNPVNSKVNALTKISKINANKMQVVWAPTPEQQRAQNSTGISGQFVVKYDVDREQNPQQILVDEGYFVHFFAPDSLPKLRKHVVFVLDYSGSMYGRKLDQLKDAMATILSDLDPTDYFSLVTFDSNIKAWSPKKIYNLDRNDLNSSPDIEYVIEASIKNINLSKAYLENLSDGGLTNIMGGLRTGLQLVSVGSDLWENESDAPQPLVVFLTDGEPNVEEFNTETIITKTKVLNKKKSPIFSLAFGDGADFRFLRKLSLNNFGFARNIYEAADASAQLKNFYSTVTSPLLSDVTFSYLPDQVLNSSNTKRQFHVFFKGSEIIVAGRITEDAARDKTTIGELSGLSATGPYKCPIVIDILKPQNRTLGHLEKTWAYLTIQQLLDKVDSLDDGQEKNQTKSKALELALQYSFVTSLTSLVVVKPNGTEYVDTKEVKPVSGSTQLSQRSGVHFLTSQQFIKSGVLNSAPQKRRNILHKIRITSTSYLPSYSLVTHKKVNIRDVEWLKPFLSNAPASGNVTVGQYYLGLYQNDTSFGACTVNGVSGECHHLQYCSLSVFQDKESAFIPYHCPITGGYLGVCCPEYILQGSVRIF